MPARGGAPIEYLVLGSCNGFQIPLPILVSTKLKASIDLTGKG